MSAGQNAMTSDDVEARKSVKKKIIEFLEGVLKRICEDQPDKNFTWHIEDKEAKHLDFTNEIRIKSKSAYIDVDLVENYHFGDLKFIASAHVGPFPIHQRESLIQQFTDDMHRLWEDKQTDETKAYDPDKIFLSEHEVEAFLKHMVDWTHTFEEHASHEHESDDSAPDIALPKIPWLIVSVVLGLIFLMALFALITSF